MIRARGLDLFARKPKLGEWQTAGAYYCKMANWRPDENCQTVRQDTARSTT